MAQALAPTRNIHSIMFFFTVSVFEVGSGLNSSQLRNTEVVSVGQKKCVVAQVSDWGGDGSSPRPLGFPWLNGDEAVPAPHCPACTKRKLEPTWLRSSATATLAGIRQNSPGPSSTLSVPSVTVNCLSSTATILNPGSLKIMDSAESARNTSALNKACRARGRILNRPALENAVSTRAGSKSVKSMPV